MKLIKDYQQSIDNENTYEINDNNETRNNDYNINNNSLLEEKNSMNDSLYQRPNFINANNKKPVKMNFDYKVERNLLGNENLKNLNSNKMKEDMNNIQNKKEKYSLDETNDFNKRIIYNEERTMKNANKNIIYNDEYDIGMKDGLKYYNRRVNDKNFRNDEFDDNYNKEKTEINNKIQYKTNDNFYDNENYLKLNDINKRYSSSRQRKNMNYNSLGIKSCP